MKPWGWDPIVGSVSLGEEKPEFTFSLSHEEMVKRWTFASQEVFLPLPRTKSEGPLMLDFPASRTVRSKWVLPNQPVYGILLQQLKHTHTIPFLIFLSFGYSSEVNIRFLYYHNPTWAVCFLSLWRFRLYHF